MAHCINCKSEYPIEADAVHHAPCQRCQSDGHSDCQHGYDNPEAESLSWWMQQGVYE